MPHLLLDISAHGLGHLGQVAPIINALAQRVSGLRLTVKSALPRARLEARLALPFAHVEGASDFGFRMLDAMRIDRVATAEDYRRFHANWPQRVADEADAMRKLQPDFVLCDVAYLPLAAAARCGIAAAAMSSLNWADLVALEFADDAWAAPVIEEMRDAYRTAPFLALTPAMPMPWLPEVITVGPVAMRGQGRRQMLCSLLGIDPLARVVLVALGGLAGSLPVEEWTGGSDIVWLVSRDWKISHPRCRDFEVAGWSFPELLASVDAVVCKPGYGTFTEAACAGVPVAYLRRESWPEQEPLIEWLRRVGVAAEVTEEVLVSGAVSALLDRLWAVGRPQAVEPVGVGEAAEWLTARMPTPCGGCS